MYFFKVKISPKFKFSVWRIDLMGGKGPVASSAIPCPDIYILIRNAVLKNISSTVNEQ